MRLRLRSGVAEIISVTVLILVAVAIGVGFYYTAKSLIDESAARVMRSISRAQAQLGNYVVVDAFYISANQTLVLYIYASEGESITFDKLYIDNELVNPSNYTNGFDTPIRIGYINRLAAIVQLSTGTHEVLITSPEGVKLQTTVVIE